MAIIPTVEPQGPRIGPRVFADVPSQHEVLQAQDQVRQAKGRAFAFFAALLVAIGAAAALGFLYTQEIARAEQSKPDQQALEAKHKAELDERDRQITKLEDDIRALERDYAAFHDLNDAAAEVRDARQEIAMIIDQNDKAGVLDDRRARAWAKVYRSPSTLAADLEASKAKLEAELSELQRLKRFADSWRPPTRAPQPCLTEVGCAPGTSNN